METISEDLISELLTHTKSLFNHIYWFKQEFDLLPEKEHHGCCIDYTDTLERREEFCDELVNTVVEWVYSNAKSDSLIADWEAEGRSKRNAESMLRSTSFKKFRHRDSRDVFIQGQFGELLLFNFIQHFFKAVPLLRKQPITTSDGHERFGVDAIHYKKEGEFNIIILGESKAYISASFADAFKTSLESIMTTYENHRSELNLYLYDDFIDESLVSIAKKYKNGTLDNSKVHLVCFVAYNETKIITKDNEAQIKEDIRTTIEERCSRLNKTIFEGEFSIPLSRLNYVIFPFWKLNELMKNFQQLIGR